MNFEYYYLFGLDINAKKYNLGTVKQPRLIDLIDNEIELNEFYSPFLYTYAVIEQSSNKESITELKDKLGSLTFMLLSCIQAEDKSVLIHLSKALEMMYDNDVQINTEDWTVRCGDVIIDNSNFDALCDLVLEMLKIDKTNMKFEKEEDPYKHLPKAMLEAKKKFLERNKSKNKEDDTFTLLDIANVVIHSREISYDMILGMTVYQLKNSFEVLNIKESFDVSTLYRVSPKFDMSKDKFSHWTEKIKISKSRLAD